MKNVFRAVRILASNSPAIKMGIDQIGASLANMGSTEKERDNASYSYWEAAEAAKTNEEREILFMDALKKRLAANGDESGLSLIEAASDQLLKCLEEREGHGWAIISHDCQTGITSDYTVENTAWHTALKVLAGLLDAVIDGISITQKASIEALAEKVSKLEIPGYTLQAKAWMKSGKKRIYITVYDAEGNPQPEVLYWEGGKTFWKYTPKTRPIWADQVSATIKAIATE